VTWMVVRERFSVDPVVVYGIDGDARIVVRNLSTVDQLRTMVRSTNVTRP
jgi:hypothetical protein